MIKTPPTPAINERRTQVLLAEYAEAGQLCRAHEQNSRTALSVYLALASAIVGVSFTNGISNAGQALLFFLGFAVGLFLLNTVLRHRAYYSAYMARAKAIEKELQMMLYTQAWRDVRSCKTFSNKHAIAAIIVLVMISLLVGAFVRAA